MYIGYTLSCYSDKNYFYSGPFNLPESLLKKELNRKFIINGEPLTKTEFIKLSQHIVEAAEIVWSAELEFYVEGSNFPEP